MFVTSCLEDYSVLINRLYRLEGGLDRAERRSAVGFLVSYYGYEAVS
jgi:hypothetical protein